MGSKIINPLRDSSNEEKLDLRSLQIHLTGMLVLACVDGAVAKGCGTSFSSSRRAWQEIVGRHSFQIIIPLLRICGVADDDLGEFPTRNRVEVCSKGAGLTKEMVLTPRSKTPKKPFEQGASRI